MNFQFDVTQQEAELILNAIAQRPFAEVSQLMGKLQQQAQTQVQAAQQAKPE